MSYLLFSGDFNLLFSGDFNVTFFASLLQNQIAFISEMALPLCISAINFVLPFAFSILASFEKYKSPRIELYITMIRYIMQPSYLTDE